MQVATNIELSFLPAGLGMAWRQFCAYASETFFLIYRKLFAFSDMEKLIPSYLTAVIYTLVINRLNVFDPSSIC